MDLVRQVSLFCNCFSVFGNCSFQYGTWKFDSVIEFLGILCILKLGWYLKYAPKGQIAIGKEEQYECIG